MRISDWSSDVCSSDLESDQWRFQSECQKTHIEGNLEKPAVRGRLFCEFHRLRSEERRVGKECAVRVDLGGRRIIKKKNKKLNKHCQATYIQKADNIT